MTTSYINNTWVFYGQANDIFYYFEDIENQVHTFEEALRADMSIFHWLLTGDYRFVLPHLRNEIGFQTNYQEADAHFYGEEVNPAYIFQKTGDFIDDIWS